MKVDVTDSSADGPRIDPRPGIERGVTVRSNFLEGHDEGEDRFQDLLAWSTGR